MLYLLATRHEIGSFIALPLSRAGVPWQEIAWTYDGLDVYFAAMLMLAVPLTVGPFRYLLAEGRVNWGMSNRTFSVMVLCLWSLSVLLAAAGVWSSLVIGLYQPLSNFDQNWMVVDHLTLDGLFNSYFNLTIGAIVLPPLLLLLWDASRADKRSKTE
ncbi:MAG: hypothetical protein AAGC81_12260 [Pseudomonadota bacterium]